MDVDKLKRGNELLKEIDDHMAKIANLSSNIYQAKEKSLWSFTKIAKLFKRSTPREKKFDKTEGVWYWTYSAEPERLVELSTEDLEVLVEGYRNRIAKLEKEFDDL